MLNPMSHSRMRASQVWIAALQVAVVLASIALSVFPQVRTPAVVVPFMAASLANCAMMCRREWKSGRLHMTPGQLLQRAQAGERFPTQALGLGAAVASCIAQWHISMG